MSKTIIIEIEGGALVDVRNLPEGWDYELIDWDITGRSDEVAD